MKLNIIFLFIITISFLIYPQGIINGGFELGSSGWTIWSKSGQGLIGTAAFFSSTSITPAVYPKSGEYMARLGGFGYDESELSQTITLPNTTPLYLSFHYQSRSFTGAECAGLYHGGEVKIVIAGQMLYNAYLCYYNDLHQWTFGYFDVSAAAGQTISVILRVDAANSMWSYLYLDDVSLSSAVPVEDEQTSLPFGTELKTNYPNPFNPSTVISFTLPRTEHVSLKVFDIMGNEVATLVDGIKNAGTHEIIFDAGNFPSGVYFYELVSGSQFLRKKMMLLK
ncbi:MAG: T9SS type A sorting domain-containing protein [Ignavibacteriaceae bacterium]